MAGLKEILGRIKSVKNTKKITYAMKLVSATKMKGAQDSVTKSRSYSNAIRQLLNDVMEGSDFDHPLLQARDEVKKIRLIVIGANRGLCGSYNSNINKAIKKFFDSNKNVQVETVLIGKKVVEYCKRSKISMTETHSDLPETPSDWPLDEIAKKAELDFLNKQVDEVYFIYTKFKSALSMSVQTEKLLPIDKDSLLEQIKSDKQEATTQKQTLFEPSAKKVFSELLPRILRVLVLQASLDAKASEYGSRMTAMDTATKNAGELIEALTLKFNKLRQASITSEILDIVGGANAVK